MNANEKRNLRANFNRRYEESIFNQLVKMDEEKGNKTSVKINRLASKQMRQEMTKGINLSDLEDLVNYEEERETWGYNK